MLGRCAIRIKIRYLTQQQGEAKGRQQTVPRRLSKQQSLQMAAGCQDRSGGERGHFQMGHREHHSAVHLHGRALVSGLEALHVQTQHWWQLPDGHLL